MSIWSEATVFIPSPKHVNIKQLTKIVRTKTQ